MSARLNPYLNFRDTARQAMEFYQSVFGGELNLSTFSDYEGIGDSASADRIMHGQLETPDGLVLMGSDTPGAMEYTAPAGFAVSLSGDEDARLHGYWDALAP